MVNILRSKKYKLNPVTRAVLILSGFALWTILSTFINTKSQNQDVHTGRNLLALEETSDAQMGEEMSAVEAVSSAPAPEEVTRVEVVASGNASSDHCIQPAVTQFPSPILHKEQRKQGGVILHIVVAFYMFIGLAIVCEDYFVPSLNRVSDALGLSPDVAGATFMAAGSSAPELATSVIGAFVAKDDIGVGSVVGSAVFNITLVVAVCSLSATHAIQLSWYSVCRDCFCYLMSIIILILTIANSVITWYEAASFLLAYLLYCIAMSFNTRIEAWCQSSLPVPSSWRHPDGDDENNCEPNDQKKDVETRMGADGTTEIILTPARAEAKEFKDIEFKDPLKKPLALDEGKWAVFCWFVLSFLISVTWICVYSYVMVWMITVVGFTFGIPDTVMGLTFIAAGVSVPDCLSGVAVVKEGHGDMAISNALGSNVFDILMCLGLPWFLQTCVISPGSRVKVLHKGILYSTLTLLTTVVFLIGAAHSNNWKMDKRLGGIMLFWYFVVMGVASLYETNILGDFNPVECESDW